MSPRPLPVPPFDTELKSVLDRLKEAIPTVALSQIAAVRAAMASPAVESLLHGRPIHHEEKTIPVPGGEIVLSTFRLSDHHPGGLGIYHVHGGGMIMGDRFSGAATYLEWVEQLDAVVVSVEYRLAPEFPDPTPVSDSYAGLLWTAAHSEELGFDPGRLVVAGASAGAGIAAGISLKARDDDGPALAGSLLMCPMLDHRDATTSSRQMDGVGLYDRAANKLRWRALLGTRARTGEVSHYASPSRAHDLSGLPPTFVDVGSAEVFRDEAVAYAARIWEQGGIAELHVWPGGFHGFDVFAPHARLSVEARAAQLNWLRRVVGP